MAKRSGVTAFYVVVVAVVVVAGGVSAIVVVLVSVGVTGLYGPAVPSTPVVGWGGAWPEAPVEGASFFESGGWVMSGGAFW